MAISFAELSGGGINDEGAELIASFNYDTIGKKIEDSFDSGSYLATLYGENGSNVRIFIADSSGNGSLLAQLSITESGQSQFFTLPENIIRIVVIGTSSGSIVIRKMSEVAAGTVEVIPDPSSWSLLAGGPTWELSNLDYNGSTVIAPRGGGTRTEYSVSQDGGSSWTDYSNLPSGLQNSAIVYAGNDTWVMATESSDMFRYRRSTDNGVTWTNQSYNYNGWGNISMSGMDNDGAEIVAISKQYQVNAAFRSTNRGSSWNFYSLPSNNNNYCSIAFVGGYYIAPGFQGNNIAYSTSGTSWTNVTGNVPSRGGVAGFKDNTFYVPAGGAPGLGGGNSSVVYVATGTPDTWTTRSLPISAYWGAVSVIDDTIYMTQFATGGSYPGEILTSTDGVTWTRRSAPNVVVPRLKQPDGGTVIGAVYSASEGTSKILAADSSYGVS